MEGSELSICSLAASPSTVRDSAWARGRQTKPLRPTQARPGRDTPSQPASLDSREEQ